MTSSCRVRSPRSGNSSRGNALVMALVLILLAVGAVVAYVMTREPAPTVTKPSAAKPAAAAPAATSDKEKVESSAQVQETKGPGRKADKPIRFSVVCLGPGGANEPLANVPVSAAPAITTGLDLENKVSATTNAQGVAEFRDLPYMIYEVAAEPAGFVPLRLRGGKDGNRLELLFQKGTTCSGTVVNGETGAPIADAYIQLRSDFGMAAVTKRIQMAIQQGVDPRDIQGYELLDQAHPYFRAEATSDASGKFTFPTVPFNTDLALSIEHDSYDSFDEHFKPTTADPIQRELRLLPRVDIFGKVLADDTGEPIPGVKVEAAEGGIPVSVVAMLGRGSGVIVDSVTDANGAYRLKKLPRGRQYVSVSFPGYEEYTGTFEIKSTEPEYAHEIRLKRASTLSGVVVDSADQPIEGVAVYYVTAETQIMGNKGLPAEPHARTGADGTFHLRGVPVNRSFNVIARHPDYLNAQNDRLNAKAGEELVGVKIVMSHGGNITGAVVDALRQPIAGASIIATPIKPPGSPLRAVPSGADGSFVISNTQPATFEITCDAPGYCQGKIGNVGDVSTGVQFVLVREAVYAGRLLTGDGAPVTRFKLRCKMSNASADAPIRSEQFRDKEGRFEVKGLSPGLWDFELTGEGQTPLLVQRVALREAERIENQELRFQEGAKVGGTVQSLSGKPVQSALVRLDFLESFSAADKTFTSLQGSTNSNGEFEIKNLLPGRYLIWASHPSFAPVAEREIVIEPGPRQEVDFSLSKPASLRVVVRDHEGNTVPQASVSLFKGDSPLDTAKKIVKNGMVGLELPQSHGDRNGITTVQDQQQGGGMKVAVGETGEVTFSRREPGDWTLWVQCQGYYKYTAKLSLEAGKESVHEAELVTLQSGLPQGEASGVDPKELARRRNERKNPSHDPDHERGKLTELTVEEREVLAKQKDGEELTADEMEVLKKARRKVRDDGSGGGEGSKEANAEKRRQQADTDGDGKVSPEEREALKKRQEKRKQKQGEGGGEGGTKPGGDANKDGGGR